MLSVKLFEKGNHIKKLLYIVSILLAPIFSVHAENSPVIHLVTEHLPPYQIEDDNKSLSGFAVEVIRETIKRSQYDYTMNSYSWVRSYNLAQMKANHCIFSIARTKTRENLFKWVGAISKINNTSLWARKDRVIDVTKLEDAKKYTIAVNRNDVTHIGLMERGFKEDEHLYVLDDGKSLINLLITRPEIDLIVADDTTIKFRTELEGIAINKLQRIYEIKDLPLNFHLACSKQTNDDIIKHLAEKLQSLYQDGSYEAILDKWRDKFSVPKL
ncbi:transporter substrate-binding domain-containing protein [Colwellia sp. BRX10-3]|uniref:substrate-binding periplasmic protein n=1 Tax=Colwellia sp. BRX10-3 TaxID=2759844 RepID=UPI0015F773E3|nr:transporter substrate-binding domain-containing protein [Colwellia sp. BRX10-3]MBA6392231.1 transporter substrate-binding domain-containing protein [Colwellia sp. BRX10-3]